MNSAIFGPEGCFHSYTHEPWTKKQGRGGGGGCNNAFDNEDVKIGGSGLWFYQIKNSEKGS